MIEESNYGVELVVIGAHNGNKIQNLIRSTVGKIILVEPVRDLFFKLQEIQMAVTSWSHMCRYLPIQFSERYIIALSETPIGK